MTLKNYITVLYEVESKLEITIEGVNETLIINKTAYDINEGSLDLMSIFSEHMYYDVIDTILDDERNKLFLRIAPQ